MSYSFEVLRRDVREVGCYWWRADKPPGSILGVFAIGGFGAVVLLISRL